MIKKLSFFAALIVISLFGLVPFVSAATTGTVTATVTAQNISISVADGGISYGTLALASSKDTTASGLNDTQTATNTGNVAEDFTIKGSNSADWTLGATSASEQYVHQFSTNSGSVWTALTTSDQSLASNISSSGTKQFDLKITVPTSTAATGAENVDVTITASAH